MNKPILHIRDLRNQHEESSLSNILKDMDNPLGVTKCLVTLDKGVKLRGMSCGDHIFIDNYSESYFFQGRLKSLEDVEPFFTAEVLEEAYTKEIEVTKYVNVGWNRQQQTVKQLDSYDPKGRWDPDPQDTIPYAYLKIQITVLNSEPVVAEFRFKQPTTGKAVLDPVSADIVVTSDFYGLKRTWKDSLRQLASDRYSYSEKSALEVLYTHLKDSEITPAADYWWLRFFSANQQLTDNSEDTQGLSAVLKQKDIAPNIRRLKEESEVDYKFMCFLQSSQTQDKQKNNSLLQVFLKTTGTDYSKLLRELQKARKNAVGTASGYYHDRWFGARRSICLGLPGAVQRVEEAEAKEDWRKRKTAEDQASGLGISAEAYPLLYKAVVNSDIPTSVFHQPNGNAVNTEFALWEKSLKQKGWAEVIYSIAKTASRRSTYEKDISPYLAFLFRIPKYLEKHTKKKWKVQPVFVESQWELEMAEESDTHTTTKRSALTPVADNVTGVLTVPYIAMCVSGVHQQWCYSRFYHLFEEGFTDPESGGIVLADYEEKLNGRDDYGLMYYTLTGTYTARGYPTFLIIFERLKDETRVHFHRVRPQRSKDGKQTPACKLVEACYQYMAGNVTAADVYNQQGDLIFIKHPNDPVNAGAKVAEPLIGKVLEFESHKFESSADLKLYISEAKTPANRLGFLYAADTFSVRHPEHQDLEDLESGWIEVRRTKSWESNPRSVWSLTID